MRRPLRFMMMLVCMLAANVSMAASMRHLVLVSASTDVPVLSPLELQKLFLGMPISKNNKRLWALRNQSEALLYEVFLQKAVFMSAKTYEHQVLAQVFESGSQRPPVYKDTDKLVEALHNKPFSLSYMWISDIKPGHRIRVVQELWQGSTE